MCVDNAPLPRRTTGGSSVRRQRTSPQAHNRRLECASATSSRDGGPTCVGDVIQKLCRYRTHRPGDPKTEVVIEKILTVQDLSPRKSTSDKSWFAT